MRSLITAMVILSIAWSCNESEKSHATNVPAPYRTPSYFPEMHVPADNQPTQARIQLGRKLFYEKRLSIDGKTSCGSCHITSMAFTDGKMTSIGAHGKMLQRNASTLANLAWAPHYLSEGGVKSLELQVLGPIQDTTEMSLPLHGAARQLNQDEEYNSLSQIAYQRPLDEYVIIRAIACFERSLISADSRFDRWYFQKQTHAFNEEEKKGYELFFSERLACGKCHTLPFFTDFEFYNIGLYETDTDLGRSRVTYLEDDNGKFKTPTLRNIEFTAPYMHDGSIVSLEEVIEFYNSGGHNHPNKNSRIKPLNLSETEKQALLAFLKTLSDWNFVQNQTFVPLEK